MLRNPFPVIVGFVFLVPLALPERGAAMSPTGVGGAATVGVSPPARALPASVPNLASAAEADRAIENRPLPKAETAISSNTPDGALQTSLGPLNAQLGPAIPVPSLSFEGVSNNDNSAVYGGRIVPPDTNGDVGPNHYVQSVNLLLRVFDKTGTPLTAPFKMSTLFASIGAPCGTLNEGDPVVLYDQLADRWLVSQLALPNGESSPPYHECVAISQTGDPTGTYFLYDFVMPGNNLNDYPKFGVWPDGYYMTDNQFLNGGSFNGAGVFAFDRDKMLAGDPTASFLYFNLASFDATIGGLLPADADGLVPPAMGRPNTMAYFTADEFGDPQGDALRLFDVHVDFATPASSTFTERAESPVAVAAFDPTTPPGAADVPQPSPGVAVDALTDRLMHRLQYRNFGAHESLVVNHTVKVTASPYKAGVRYYEVRRPLPSGTFAIAEQATFSPDSESRWMGSAAMDNQGNLAVGYSVSSSTVFPSVRYAGRLAGDPPNQLAQGEATLVDGTGVQTDSSSRWGDYSAMSVDPSDDCTFWYTNEYYTAAGQASSSRGWQTRIGSFIFPGCTAPPNGALNVTVTDCASSAPIAGASVQTDDGYFRLTDGTGLAAFALMNPDNYVVTAFKSGFGTDSASVAVSTGGTASLNLCLIAPPSPTATAPPTVTPTLTLPPTATATAVAPTCVTFQTGVCCTDASGTNCASTVCTANANCTVAPFQTCAGASADDGRTNELGSGVYPPNGGVTASPTFTTVGPQRALYSGPGFTTYVVQNGLVRFNTGPTLPDTATVTSAALIMRVTQAPYDTDGLQLMGEWFNWGPTVGAEDYAEVPAGSAFALPISSVGTGSNTVGLSAAAGNVSVTGYTYLRLHVSQRAGDAPPTGVNLVSIAMFDHSTVAGPALQVCYTLTAASPTPTPSGTATSAPTPTDTPAPSVTATLVPTPTFTLAATATNTAGPSVTDTPSVTATDTAALTVTPTATGSDTPTTTGTVAVTATDTVAPTATLTLTPASTATFTPLPVSTATATITGAPPTVTPTLTLPPTATATAVAPTCVTFRTGVCCTDASGTNCSSTVCTANANCTVAPFQTCAGASADDGRTNELGSGVYPPNGGVTASPTFTTVGPQRALYSGPGFTTYVVQNGLVRFNTGPTLPDTATVTSAALIMRVTQAPYDTDGLQLMGEWFNWGPTVGAEDYAEVPAGSAFALPISSVGTGSNTVGLSAAAGNVSVTGYTYLRLHVSQRAGDAPPTGVNLVSIAMFDHSTVAGPALQVCYTLTAASPTPTPSGTATSVPTSTDTPLPTFTATSVPTPTFTALPGATATATPTDSAATTVTATPLSTPTATPLSTFTDTPVVAPTATPPQTLPPAPTETPSVPPPTAPPTATAQWNRKGGSLNLDTVGGWATRPSLAVNSDGTLYAAWVQRRRADVNEETQIRAARWDDALGQWVALGGRISHTSAEAAYPEAYAPSATTMGTQLCVAWYEGGQGWTSTIRNTVWVRCWDGTQWNYLLSSINGGSLNTSTSSPAWDPVLTTVGGVVYVAFRELRGNAATEHHVLVVKHWDGTDWVRDGGDITTQVSDRTNILSHALASVSGVPTLAWSEVEWRVSGAGFAVTTRAANVYVSSFTGGTWGAIGGAVADMGTSTGFVALADFQGAPVVAYQQRPSATAPFEIHTKSFEDAWTALGTPSVISSGVAGPPTLAADGTRIALAWTEAGTGAQLMYREYTALGGWSPLTSGLNSNQGSSARRPHVVLRASLPEISWSEYHETSRTRQVLVTGRESATTGTVAPTAFGADGATPTIPDNTWVALNPGGIAFQAANQVCDEGFDSGVYVGGATDRLLRLWAKYHDGTCGSGENQTAVFAYDFTRNRWDPWEFTEAMGSTEGPGTGHAYGSIGVDAQHQRLLFAGNLTLGGAGLNIRSRSIFYDIPARMGTPLWPATDLDAGMVNGTIAYSPDRDQFLAVWATGACRALYTPTTNTWSATAVGPSCRAQAGLVYNAQAKAFVLVGGTTGSSETWTYDAATNTWTNRFPAVVPPAGQVLAPSLAYDSGNNVVVWTGSGTNQVWVYTLETNTWTQLGNAPITAGTGRYLAYDDTRGLWLLSASNDLQVYAYRYVPANVPTSTPTPSGTATSVPTPTDTPAPTPTDTAVATLTATSGTPPPTDTAVVAPTATATNPPGSSTDTPTIPPTDTPTATLTATPTAGCVTFRLGVCCTDRTGTNCSTTTCTSDASCGVAPFLTCGGTSADDGIVSRSGSAVYPPNTTIVASSTATEADVQRSLGLGPAFSVQNGLMRFNTAAVLPNNARVTSATLTLRVIGSLQNVDGWSLTGDWYDWGPTVGPEDYSETAVSSAFSLPLLSITSNIIVSLSAPDANVSLTGYTYLRTHLSQWVDDPPPLGLNMVRFALFDNASLAGPALQVCYDYSLPIATPTPTPSATSTQTPASTPFGQTTVIFATGVCCTDVSGTDCEDRSPATSGMQYRGCNVDENCANAAYPVCAGHSVDDGNTQGSTSPTYPPAFTQCLMNTGNLLTLRSRQSGLYSIQNSLVQFYTAPTLPEDAVIDSAVLRAHVVSNTDRANNLNFEGEWYDWSGTCDVSDYTTTSSSTAFSVPMAAITNQSEFDFPLAVPTNVKVAGSDPTRLRFSLSTLPGNAPPTGLNTMVVSAWDADHSVEPGLRLIITYHLPTPSPTLTATETPTGSTPTDTPVQSTSTAMPTVTGTPTATATCVIFRTGSCCTDSSGTDCAETPCGGNAACQVYPFLVCAGSSTDDGQANRSGSAVYPPNTTAIANTNVSSADTQRSASAGPSYAVQNGLMRFNTSKLPDGATVVSAQLIAQVIAPPQSADALSLQGEWFNWSPSIGPEDFSEVPSSTAFSLPVSTIVPGSNAIPLADAAGNVSRTGYTYLRTHMSQLPGDAAPSGINLVQIAMYDLQYQPGPALQVCYK